MTEEDLVKEGRISGIDFFGIYDWTWGEINEYIQVIDERERRRNKNASIIAFSQINMLSEALSKDGSGKMIFELFPFWTDEEQKNAMVERYKQSLQKHAKKKGK